MLFYLTNLFLDVVYGSVFWVLKKTSNGIYYLIKGDSDEMIQITREEYETLMLLRDKNNLQEEQIKLLKDKLEDD